MRQFEKHYTTHSHKAIVVVFVVGLFLAGPVIAENTVTAPSAEEGSWTKAGQEVAKAAGAVGEASKKTWNSTKESSAETWDKTKETSSQAWDKTKDAGSGVAEGSAEIADATVETSKSVWQKTKEASSRWYKNAKRKVNDMTGPSPEQ